MKERTIAVQFSDTLKSQEVAVDCLVDTGADITCIPEEFAKALGLTPGPEIMQIMDYMGKRRVLNTTFVNVRLGTQTLPNLRVLIVPGLPKPLLGWDILSNSSIFTAVNRVIFGEVLHLLSCLPVFKERAVLILGQDTTEIHRLHAIQRIVENLGYTGLVVKDVSDLEIQSIEEKVNMLASLCRFVICDNSIPSGHIDELKICANNRFVTAIVQEEGLGATWMQSDYTIDFNFMRSFTYQESSSMEDCVRAAVEWAEKKVEARKQYFNNLYHWETGETGETGDGA